MRPISSPTVSNAVVALFVVSGLAVSAGIRHAQAEDCLAAPNVSSPPGQHWYYRIDRATRRHCWYLHAPLRVAHQAHRASEPGEAEIERPAPAAPIPFAAAPMPAAAPPMPPPDPPVAALAPAADPTPSPPQVTVLAVKTIAVRPPGARMETPSRHHVGDASIQRASARAYRMMPGANPQSTIFFVFVFGLGLIVFLTAIVIKRLAPQASWLWPIRMEAGTAWQHERRDYFNARPGPLKDRSWSAHA